MTGLRRCAVRPPRRAAALAAVLCLPLTACSDTDAPLVLVGSVERTLVELAAPAPETIAAILVRRGQTVEAGETVARLDATVAGADLARADAAIAAARSAEAIAAHDLERVRNLGRKRITTPQDLERARLAWEEAVARLHEAEATAEVARKRLADLELRSPAAGTVDQIPFEVGERVPAGAVLVVLERAEAPWVRTWIPEHAAGRLRPGAVASIARTCSAPSVRGCLGHLTREPEFTPHYALTERERAHLVYEARIELAAEGHDLRSGTPVTITFAADAVADPAGAGGLPCGQ